MPGKTFQVLRDGATCTVEFFDNVESAPMIDGMTGQSAPSWDYERYTLTMPYQPNLAAEIEADFPTWLQKAKDAETAAEEQKVRDYRDDLLNTCDTVYYNAERWAVMTDEQRQAWAAYKQALRDVPTQAGFPYSVSWPAMPAEGGTT